MAYMDADAILTAVRDVIEDNAGTLRAIAESRFAGSLPDGLTDSAASVRAMSTARAEATIVKGGLHKTNYPINSNMGLRSITVRIVVIRHLHLGEKLSDSLRDDAKALAAQDGDVLWQALSCPGNLTLDSGANATGIVSGMLNEWAGSDLKRLQLRGEEAGLLETVHTFRGVVKVTQAVS